MNNRGGKRKGAGRPKGPKTTVISFRVEKDKAQTLMGQIKKIIKL